MGDDTVTKKLIKLTNLWHRKMKFCVFISNGSQWKGLQCSIMLLEIIIPNRTDSIESRIRTAEAH